MKGRKKQLLGWIGLAAVAAITTAAYNLPAPEAAAVEGPDESTADQTFTISVTVQGEKPYLNIDESGLVVRNRKGYFAGSYNKLKAIDGEIVCTSDKDSSKSETIDVSPDLEGRTSGRFSESFTVSESLGDANCQLTAEATAVGGVDNIVTRQQIDFKVRAASVIVPGGNPGVVDPDIALDFDKDEDNNPIIGFNVDDGVDEFKVQVYNKDGKPVFVNKDGKETPLIISSDKIDPVTGKLLITLPMDEYGAKAGEYEVTVVMYRDGVEISSIYELKFDYVPKFTAPNTGSLFEEMNISRADYVITGLIAFGAMAMFAMYLIFRKSRR